MRISDWSSRVLFRSLDRQAAAVATPDHGTQRHRRGGFIRLSQESGDDVAVGGAVGGRQDRRGEVAAAGVGPAAAEKALGGTVAAGDASFGIAQDDRGSGLPDDAPPPSPDPRRRQLPPAPAAAGPGTAPRA